MPEFRRRLIVGRPRKEVWAFITDHTNALKWMPKLRSIEIITEGEPGVGTRYRETRSFNGRDAVAEIEVTAFEPPVEYAAGTRYAGALFEYRYRLSAPTEGTTEIELIASARPEGLLGTLAAIPMLKMMQRVDGDHLRAIKETIESELVGGGGGSEAMRGSAVAG